MVNNQLILLEGNPINLHYPLFFPVFRHGPRYEPSPWRRLQTWNEPKNVKRWDKRSADLKRLAGDAFFAWRASEFLTIFDAKFFLFTGVELKVLWPGCWILSVWLLEACDEIVTNIGRRGNQWMPMVLLYAFVMSWRESMRKHERGQGLGNMVAWSPWPTTPTKVHSFFLIIRECSSAKKLGSCEWKQRLGILDSISVVLMIKISIWRLKHGYS